MKNRHRLPPAKLLTLEAACRDQGLPLTVQRRVILEALAGRDDHPTADDILAQVRGQLPEISRTTVYRVLDALVRLGLAVKISSPGAAVRFDCRTDTGPDMTTIRTTCPRCGEVDMGPEAILLSVLQGGREGTYRFDRSRPRAGTPRCSTSSSPTGRSSVAPTAPRRG